MATPSGTDSPNFQPTLPGSSIRTKSVSSERGKHPVLAHCLYSFQQVPRSIGLHDIPSGPCFQCLPHHLRRVMLRDEQNLRARRPPPEQPTRFETIQPGHSNVKHHYIGLQNIGFVQGLEPVRRFPHYFPPYFPSYNILHPFPPTRCI